MKIRTLLLLLMICLLRHPLPAQTIRDTITNQKTSNHISVAGTGVFLVPPSQYRPSKSVNGFKKNDSLFISVWETKDQQLIEQSPEFEMPEQTNGVKIKTFQKIIVNGFKGAFITYQQEPTLIANAIIFGSSNFRVIVPGYFLPKARRQGKT